MAAFFSPPTSAAVKIIAPPRSDGSPALIQSEQLQCVNLKGWDVSSTILRGSGTTEVYEHDPFNPYDISNPNGERESPQQMVQGMQNLHLNEYDTSGNSVLNSIVNNGGVPSIGGMSVRVNGYYSPPLATFARQPLNYHLYTPQTYHSNATKSDNPSASFFMSDDLRQDLTQQSELTRAVPTMTMLNLPEELQGYHTLVPLDSTVAVAGKERRPNFGNWYSSIYKATSATDGFTYALRRIENFRLLHEAAFDVVEQWSKIRHPNIVTMHEAFTSRAFGDNCAIIHYSSRSGASLFHIALIISYDYHPNSMTLFDAHLKLSLQPQRPSNSQPSSSFISESVLWSYISQIGSAIRTAHGAGLAIRLIDSTKILITGKNRVRLGCCGTVDILTYDTRQDTHLLQQEDLLQFGRLLLALGCNNLMAGNNLTKSLENMTRNYSADLKSVIIYLLGKPAPHKSIDHLFDMIGQRLILEVDALEFHTDRLEGELSRELENGRIVRLLCKLGFINERPEFDCDPRWSETGDRYVIKLFRDYVFHQVDESGNPVMNLSHVLTCINKLDAGSEERIMLVSRDEQSCLVDGGTLDNKVQQQWSLYVM
ncbi:hypothetical protein Clacol_008224 [Clathrus columnatus]|uniref:PAN2-PAN3 deadenylation complex subunit PAN3 n=1 Tax=Clathrus columnatus TaxID=1419009 RepID=A0AAV5AH44_9AGAM|nr:hypothetical protein Clacol_008224 [Clathrus columnatus]